jgi:O-acetyl-ADP-ribose deacetylase (regulator of RNase III)
MPAPYPTPIFRLMHIDNLTGILQRGGMYAPNHIPHDGIGYRAIHHQHIQERRTARSVPCGPGGVIHDYVPFYFGSLPPMLLALRDGYVFGYNEGQEPLIYLINFPTKHHWKAKSRIEDIKRGLAALIDEVQRLEITSIAVPPLGCGNGGLNWSDVRPLIEEAFALLPHVHVLLYAPTGAPDADAMPVRTP